MGRRLYNNVKCSTKGCDRNAETRGMCQRCYYQKWVLGKVKYRPRQAELREAARVAHWKERQFENKYESNELPKLREAYNNAVGLTARLRLRKLIDELEVKGRRQKTKDHRGK